MLWLNLLRRFNSLINDIEIIYMTIKNKVLQTVPALLLTGLLTACGGSSGSSAGAEPTTPEPTTPEPTNTLEDEFGLWLTDLANNHVLPSYQNLQTHSALLSSQTATFCAQTNPTDNELVALQQSWRDVVTSWQTIQWLKVGPIANDNRNFRLYYWPDSKDNVGSGITSLLASSETVTEDFIAKQSVGSQGLPALELVLFATGQESLLAADDKEKRCEVISAISANVASISTEVNNAWQISSGNYHAQLTQGTGDFSSKKDAVEELVTNWLEQVERVKDEKMLVPLGAASPGLPSVAEHIVSGDAISSIQTNIATFNVIFTAGGGHGFDDILINHLSQKNIATEMTAAIDGAIIAATALEGSFPHLLKTDDGRIELSTAIDSLRALRDVLTVDFVQATDINIGFNSNDGD